MLKKNRIRLTGISFLSYALTGALIIVTGLVMGKISEYYHISLSKTSNIFTFLNAGILISIFINTWLMKLITIKTQINLSFLLVIMSVLTLIFTNNLILFSLSIFSLGMISGITMSIGTFLITYLYKGNKRAALLLITDSCFSMSGMIFPIITSTLLKNNIQWYWIYVIISIIYGIIFLFTLTVQFPNINLKNKVINYKKKENNKISIVLLSFAALFYILGQLGFILWIPEFSVHIIKENITNTGILVSNFWMSYMLGMWFFSFILKFFDLHKMLISLTGISCLLMYLFIHNTDYTYLQWIIILLGFFSSAIYTLIITLASLQTNIPSPKNINFILTSGTTGTLLTFIVTSPIVKTYGVKGALITANILYIMVFVLCIILIFFTKHYSNNIKK
ncbi:MFS transporter TsgA [Buchnera aphidicola]|uniref:MFS transporter TsgA n=1 Tax=Buchnera aphidicola TaxID=9 RepID=UPI0031B82520